MKTIRYIIILTLAIFLAACSSTTNKKDPYLNQDPATIYVKGHNLLKKGDYNDAIVAFQSLDSQYPFNKYTQKGDLELIYAFYKNSDPQFVIAAAERYIRLYPQSPDCAYAYYMAGVVDFNNGRGFLQRYFPFDMSAHHPHNYENAFRYFKIVVLKYPHSKYTPDAKRRMIYLKNTIANYYLNIAKFYYKHHAYVAAINRAKEIVLHYSKSTAIKEALEITVKSYKALGLNKLATTTQKVLDYNATRAKS